MKNKILMVLFLSLSVGCKKENDGKIVDNYKISIVSNEMIINGQEYYINTDITPNLDYISNVELFIDGKPQEKSLHYLLRF
jgi:hypothetical protein